MEDKSLFTNNQPRTISEGLQKFIDSMVEEIVLEGRPFDTQKKYLKKYSENEGLDYDKLEADITTFIGLLESLSKAFSKVQLKLAEEKGKECHISDDTVKKLLGHSSDPKRKRKKKPGKDKPAGSKPRIWRYLLLGILLLLLLVLVIFSWRSNPRKPSPNPEIQHDTVRIVQNDTVERIVVQLDTVVDLRYDTVRVVQYDTVERVRIQLDTVERVRIQLDTVERIRVQHDTVVVVKYGTEAERQYRTAAEGGDKVAQFNLACCYAGGTKGLSQNYEEAVKWYRKSADQGYDKAQNNLGHCYEQGHGVPQNYAEAKKWYQKAADQGNSRAKNNLERLKKKEEEERKREEQKAVEQKAHADAQSNPSSLTLTVNGVSFVMKLVEGGTFWMGAQRKDPKGRNYDTDPYLSDTEGPVHEVTLNTYYIAETEITQRLWKAVMGKNPSHFKGDNLPVNKVSWYDAVEFCNELSKKAGRTPYYKIEKKTKDPNNLFDGDDEKRWKVDCVPGANGFRLPTEAEWEYAARGGNKSKGYKYSGSNDLNAVAWCGGTNGPHPVKTKAPNELGIYDMSGNMLEWAQDWAGDYDSSLQINPTGPVAGKDRIRRGDDWSGGDRAMVYERSNMYLPTGVGNRNGLRIAMSVN